MKNDCGLWVVDCGLKGPAAGILRVLSFEIKGPAAGIIKIKNYELRIENWRKTQITVYHSLNTQNSIIKTRKRFPSIHNPQFTIHNFS